jgi:hypothetical protein
MAPVLSQDTSAQVTSTEYPYTRPSMDFTATSFDHLNVVGAFFVVLVIVLVAGILSYTLYKLCRPAKSPRNFRPLLLPKIIPVEEAVAAIAARTLFVANHPCQGFIAYKTDANGVKKSVRIRPRVYVCSYLFSKPICLISILLPAGSAYSSPS